MNYNSCPSTSMLKHQEHSPNSTNTTEENDLRDGLNILRFVSDKKLCPHCLNKLRDFIIEKKRESISK